MQFEKDIQFCSLLIFKRYESNMANYKWYGCYFFSLSLSFPIFSLILRPFRIMTLPKCKDNDDDGGDDHRFVCFTHVCLFVFLLLSVEIKEIKTNVKIKNKSIFWSLIALKWFDNFYPSPPFSLLLSVRFIFIFILFVCLVHLFTLQRSSECTKTIQKQHIKWKHLSEWSVSNGWACAHGRGKYATVFTMFWRTTKNYKSLEC